MSEDLIFNAGLAVTQYAGPAAADGSDRRRYQLTTEDEQITLNRQQWEALGEFICRDCGAECEGPHLDLTWDRSLPLGPS